jgi:uncharacterized membrane protein YdfJ with MMPL/SSD domain
MLGVFLAFALADVASLRQFGVGLAIAVIIDATLVRLVMLPAALLFAGEWTWYAPSMGLDDHASEPEPATTPALHPPHVAQPAFDAPY